MTSNVFDVMLVVLINDAINDCMKLSYSVGYWPSYRHHNNGDLKFSFRLMWLKFEKGGNSSGDYRFK